jgi:purine-nucleoside phosphorylase
MFVMTVPDHELIVLQLAGKPIEAPPTQVVSHEEVLEVGQLKAEVMRQLVEEVAASL